MVNPLILHVEIAVDGLGERQIIKICENGLICAYSGAAATNGFKLDYDFRNKKGVRKVRNIFFQAQRAVDLSLTIAAKLEMLGVFWIMPIN